MNASFLVPKTVEDLERRRRAISTWAESSNGFLGRSGDYMNSSLTALSTAGKWFAQADPKFGENIRNYYEWARENDVLATHTLIPPQVNRSVSGANSSAASSRRGSLRSARTASSLPVPACSPRSPRSPTNSWSSPPRCSAARPRMLRTRTPSRFTMTPRGCATCAAPR